MVAFADDNIVNIEVRCTVCNRIFTVKVKYEDYQKFIRGVSHIQHIFPYLKPAERELLISKTCGECFDKLFPEEETEDH